MKRKSRGTTPFVLAVGYFELVLNIVGFNYLSKNSCLLLVGND